MPTSAPNGTTGNGELGSRLVGSTNTGGGQGEMNPALVSEGFEPVYRDCKVMGCFLVFMAGAIGLSAFTIGTADYDALFATPDSVTPAPFSTPSPTSFGPEETREMLNQSGIIIGVSSLLSIILAWVSVKAVQSNARCMMYTGMGFNLAIFFLAFLLTEGSARFYFLIIGVLLTVFYGFMLMDRSGNLAFGLWVVEKSGHVLEQHPTMVSLTFAMILFQVILFNAILFGAITANEVMGSGAFLFLVFMAYWFEEVVYNIIGVTMSSVTANWALNLQTISSVNPVMSSFRHSCTYALGSVALGSLIVTIIKFMRMIARAMANRQGQNAAEMFLAMCCLCMLSCIEGLARWFNEWAFAYIGIYQIDFTTAASNVWSMFKNNGWEAIMNDAVTGLVTGVPTFLGMIVIGVGVFLLAHFGLEWNGDKLIIAIILAVICGIIAAVLIGLTMQLIDRAQNVIFLCYLHGDNYARFAQNHPELVGTLANKMQTRYEEIEMWPGTNSKV